jgi:signal transduction histidine kinase
MKSRRSFGRGRYLSFVLAVLMCLGIASLLGFAYRALKEWQQSAELLLTREIQEGSDILMTAVVRDMQGVQSRVLANRDWSESLTSLADTSAQVASAFALYPYPESFFLWRDEDSRVTFFHRADRYPEWLRTRAEPQGYPVVIDINPADATPLRHEIDSYASSRIRYLALNTTLGGQPYQVVARLTYGDSPRSRLYSVTGFTVNLAWIRRAYFADLFAQITPIASRGIGLAVGLADQRGQRIWGGSDGSAGIVREFPLLFLDPTMGKVQLVPNEPLQMWRIRVGPSRTSPLQLAVEDAHETLWVAGTAAFALCVGLLLSVRAVQDRATLAEMRSEFVSSVTHELKMPLANIRAVADTLTLRDVSAEKIRTYGGHLRHEERRLSHLVDNVLAYARITDVANVYTFEPVVPARLVNDVLQSFQQPLSQGQFKVEVAVPDGLPLVKADRGAMRLVFDNLLDNAIRYSTDVRAVRILAHERGQTVVLEVHDRGAGIPQEELSIVRQKFVRGRFTQPGGTGLGLGIVTRIVADHGGTFDLESTLGVGTIARVVLPTYQE